MTIVTMVQKTLKYYVSVQLNENVILMYLKEVLNCRSVSKTPTLNEKDTKSFLEKMKRSTIEKKIKQRII